MPLEPRNLDDRSFDQILEEAKQRIRLYAPEWTDHNDSDPGIALLQLFSWIAESTIYRLNQVPDDRMYLAFLDLLGIEPTPAKPARGIVAFDVNLGAAAATFAPPELLLLGAGSDAQEIYFEPDANVPLLGVGLSALLTDDGARTKYISRLDAEGEVESPFAPFGTTGSRDAALYLGLHTSESGVANPCPNGSLQISVGRAGDTGALSQSARSPGPSRTTSSGVRWQGWDGAEWRRLESEDDSDGFGVDGKIVVTLTDALSPLALAGDPDPRDRFWIRALPAPGAPMASLRHLAINAASIVQWRTFAEERLRLDSDGSESQRHRLQQVPIVHPTLFDARPQVRVEGESRPWQWARRLERRNDDEGPGDIFTIVDGDAILFGDGRHGRIPPRGEIRVSYRSGGGGAGNKIEELELALSPTGISGARVLGETHGGTDEQSVEDARESAGDWIRSNERAVTGSDFETLATSAGDVARAIALNRIHPRHPGIEVTGALSLVAIPNTTEDETAPQAPPQFLRAVADRLEAYRVLTTELFVVAPQYRRVEVKASLTVTRGRDVVATKRQAVAQVREFLHPVRGGDGEGWPIGAPVGYGQVMSRLLRLDGVVAVNELGFAVDGADVPACSDAVLGERELVDAGIPQIDVVEEGVSA